MRQATRSWFLTSLALAAAAVCGSAGATAGWASTHTLKHDFGAATAGATLQPGESIDIAVSLQMRNKADMDALTDALMSGKTSRHLTSAEFMSHYAPTQEQVAAVVTHLRNAGFTDIVVAKNRMLVSASGTAAAVLAGFNTTLAHVNINGRDAHANVADAQVPAQLAGIVNAVHGLQNVHSAHVMNRLAAAPDAGTLDKVGHAASDFSTIYDADSLKPATSGTVGIIAQGNITPTLTDLAAFATASGYPQPATRTIIADKASSDTSNDIEWNIDSQSSLGAAGGQVKSMNFYVASTLDDAPLIAAYNAAVADNTAQSINVSLGECELNAQQSGEMAGADAAFQIAVAQGQVFTVSSGDSGSYQCGGKFSGGSYPAVSPYVIAVGGTSLATTGQTQYLAETLWSCSSALSCEFNGGEGGGPSKTELAPAWQIASGVLNGSTQRGEPDISFDADPATGLIVFSGSSRPQYGGTSLAAPLFAGFWARIQSANGNTLPFPAASLYKVGPTRGTRFLHDVTSGSNGGYSAGPGWDQASGFGSFDVAKLQQFIKASKP